MFRSISTKILTSHVGLVLLLSVTLGFSSYFLLVNSLIEGQQKNLTYIARNHAEQLSAFIDEKRRKFGEIAMGEAMLAYSREYEEPALQQYFDSFGAEFPVLSYVNEQGFEEITLAGGERAEESSSSIRETELFETAAWEPNKVITLFSAAGGEPAAAHMEFAFFRNSFFNEFEGFILGKIPLFDLLEDIRTFRFGETGFLMVIDDQGVVLCHPQQENVSRKVSVEGEHSEQILLQVKAMKSDFGRATILGIDGYVAYSPVEERNWAIIATLPHEEFMVAPRALRNTVVTISLVVLALGLFVSLATARSLTKPILRLATTSGLLARGNLSQRVDIGSKDEVGALGEAFNKMAADLEETIASHDKEIAERQQAQQALGKTEEELTGINMELDRGLAEVFEALEKISSGDPSVRIPETSKIELIAELKRVVNLTAESLGEIVDLSHEFAIGLAEHFDTLSRASKGDLTARVGGSSQVELLESLSKVTNQMIESVSQEMAEREQAEMALRKERDFVKSVVDTAQTIVLVLDVEGRIVSFNPYMEEISGYKLEEVEGKDWFSTFLPEEDHSRIRGVFRQAVGNIQTRGNVNPIVTKDGQKRHIEWSDKTLKDPSGNIIGVLAVGQDVTDRMQAEEEKKRLRDHLQRAEKMEVIGILAGGVAHDLNNILSGLVSYPDLLLMDLPEDSPLRKPILTIRNSGQKAASIVEDLLTLARRGVAVTEVSNLNDRFFSQLVGVK